MWDGVVTAGTVSSFALTAVALTGIIAARYLALAGGVYIGLWGVRRERAGLVRLNSRRPSRETVRRELVLSLISSVIYALPAAVALEAWRRGGTRLYTDLGQYGWWWLPASAVVYLLVQDGYYYWLHRAMHHRRLFRWLHAGHHRSLEPTPFASFAFDPAEAALTGWLLPLMAFFVPLNLWVALALLTLMTLTAVFNHSGFEVLPQGIVHGRLGREFISASHHSIHHRRFGKNFGLYFRFWDRWMGTDAAPERAGPEPSGRIDKRELEPISPLS